MGTTSKTKVINAGPSWIALIIRYIELGEEPTDASSYSVIEGKLYRWGFSISLLKCIEGDKSDYVLAEIHEGICGQHPDNDTQFADKNFCKLMVDLSISHHSRR